MGHHQCYRATGITTAIPIMSTSSGSQAAASASTASGSGGYPPTEQPGGPRSKTGGLLSPPGDSASSADTVTLTGRHNVIQQLHDMLKTRWPNSGLTVQCKYALYVYDNAPSLDIWNTDWRQLCGSERGKLQGLQETGDVTVEQFKGFIALQEKAAHEEILTNELEAALLALQWQQSEYGIVEPRSGARQHGGDAAFQPGVTLHSWVDIWKHQVGWGKSRYPVRISGVLVPAVPTYPSELSTAYVAVLYTDRTWDDNGNSLLLSSWLDPQCAKYRARCEDTEGHVRDVVFLGLSQKDLRPQPEDRPDIAESGVRWSLGFARFDVKVLRSALQVEVLRSALQKAKDSDTHLDRYKFKLLSFDAEWLSPTPTDRAGLAK